MQKKHGYDYYYSDSTELVDKLIKMLREEGGREEEEGGGGGGRGGEREEEEKEGGERGSGFFVFDS